jgi:glucose-6-phosphate isomerase
MQIAPLGTNLGRYVKDVSDTLSGLAGADTVRRIWQKDYTVWRAEPEQIADRLGWLTVFDCMYEQIGVMQSFAQQIKEASFHHVVLLGFGGSSLGAEVLRQTFGSTPGYPKLIVLDSTLPETIRLVAGSIDPARTLFLVSSKSGTTSEPLLLLRYFWEVVEQALGKGKAGRNFVAITDSGTLLAKMAEERRFRHIFANPSDIGGRYSVLTYFGLVPGILMGFDARRLLERAEGMKQRCSPEASPADNEGAWLGACLGTLALKGRDKLTLVTSTSVRSFGLWVEQLVAESTGKQGKGIIPVSGEPLVKPDYYGNDRTFVYLRLRTDDNHDTDKAIKEIQASGHPVILLEMSDKYDLGAEFFRWEFATAVAGAVLGIHPFNQPNVQQAKDATELHLKAFSTLPEYLPSLEGTGLLRDLMSRAGRNSYVAIMAYLPQTPSVDAALTELRRKILERYHVATTLGYGPRFLHSTGQIHKGGPNTGLFLQLTAVSTVDVPIPDLPYTFGNVIDAQALGDREALKANGRDVASVRLPAPDAASVEQLFVEVC